MGKHWCSLAAGMAGLVLTLLHAGPAAAQDAECVESLRIDGHRGTGSNDRNNPFPENTIPSFEQAVLEGADVVELDVRLSADGTLVVLHGDEVNDTTDGTGCVNQLTDAELATLDAGLPDLPAAVPTLAEVLTTIDVDLNLDVKVSEGRPCDPENTGELAAAVKAAIDGDQADRTLFVSSFSLDFLTDLRELDANANLAYLSIGIPTVEELTDADLSGVNLLFGSGALDAIPDFKAAGLATAVWTVNDPEDMQDAIAAGVNVIITDAPEVAVSERAEACTVPDDMPPDDEPTDDGGCSVGPNASSGPLWLLGIALALSSRRRRSKR